MRLPQTVFLPLALVFCLFAGTAQAKPDTIALYIEALLAGDAPALEKLLAPNYWHVSTNGHIQDKEHFINSIRNRKLVVSRMTFSNARTVMIGEAKLVTATGYLKATSPHPLPEGILRFTLVLVKTGRGEQVVLYQGTPVIPGKDCDDGNCDIQ